MVLIILIPSTSVPVKPDENKLGKTPITRNVFHNAYIYDKNGKRLNNKVLKKNKHVRVYGKAFKMKNKLYYIIGKKQFVKKANF
ncbi:MAG: SLAP domain-containing protein [Lactobacillus sp.]|nr:SLAP domain-containing protein [Lactobacillus sp.]